MSESERLERAVVAANWMLQQYYKYPGGKNEKGQRMWSRRKRPADMQDRAWQSGYWLLVEAGVADNSVHKGKMKEGLLYEHAKKMLDNRVQAYRDWVEAGNIFYLRRS